MIYVIAFFVVAIWFAASVIPYLIAILIIVTIYHAIRIAPRPSRRARPTTTQHRPPRGQKLRVVK